MEEREGGPAHAYNENSPKMHVYAFLGSKSPVSFKKVHPQLCSNILCYPKLFSALALN